MLKVYSLLVHIAYRIISLLAISSEKYRQFYYSKKRSTQIAKKSTSRVLIHCASLGEYEMAKSTSFDLKTKGLEVVISFFSPSGYQNTPHTSDYFDYKVYVPMDTSKRTKEFLKTIDPDFVLFIKSEIWPNLLDQCIKSQIPFAFSGMDFTGQQGKYFSFPMNLLVPSIMLSEHFFVQSTETKETLLKNGARENQVSVCRNPRIDVILKSKSENPLNSSFIPTSKIFVFGSVYEEDIPMINSCLSQFTEFTFYIFPHHLDKKTILKFERSFGDIYVFDGEFKANNTLVFEMGLLKHIYKYADISYVGGGFQSGIHNILEAILNDSVCIIGPKNKAFPEVKVFDKTNYLHQISSPEEILDTIPQILSQKNDTTLIDQYLNKHKNCQDKLILLILQSISS